MSSTVLRREGDTVHLEHKYYGKYKFREAAPLADAAAASALVFAGERTDGGSPTRVAVKFDNGNQVYSDHMYWSQLYYNEATRFAGLPWILSQTIPEALWGEKKVDVMITELLGDSLETVRLRNPERSLPPRAVCCVAMQTLDMLAAMHAAGIVHRDIKPANLLLPLARTGPQQLHIIDFGIAGKIDARGAAQGQNPDGTPLYAHRGAALRAPVSFRDDLEALGYTLLALAAGSLPWEGLAMAQLPKKAQEKRSRDVAVLKRSSLAAALAAVQPPPLSAALRAYFGALRLEQGADNAARFDYGELRLPFCDAYVQLAGVPYAPATLDLDAPAPVPAAGAAAAGRKRRAPKAAVAEAAEILEDVAAPQQPKKRRSTRQRKGRFRD